MHVQVELQCCAGRVIHAEVPEAGELIHALPFEHVAIVLVTVYLIEN